MARCTQRSQRLQEALRAVRGNSALLEELLAWLSEAQALLVTKEKDIMSDDLTVVEALLKEHLVSHLLLDCSLLCDLVLRIGSRENVCTGVSRRAH